MASGGHRQGANGSRRIAAGEEILSVTGLRTQFGPTTSVLRTSAASGRPRPTLSKPMSGMRCAWLGAARDSVASATDAASIRRIVVFIMLVTLSRDSCRSHCVSGLVPRNPDHRARNVHRDTAKVPEE